jgi:two-component system, NarL family, nitrate/nitrite response regulator NarL
LIRVILLSDQPILEAGVRAAFENTPDIDLVASMGTGCMGVGVVPELLAAVETHPKCILLLNFDPKVVTFDFLSALKRELPGIKIVLWVDAIATELAFQAMGLGIRGVLRKTLPTELLTKCLLKVEEGELWFEKALTDSFLSAKRVALTQREGQLIRVLASGCKNKEIATALGITEGTVKVYLSRLFQKLGVKDRFELALYALKNLGGEKHVADANQGLRSIVLRSSPDLAA